MLCKLTDQDGPQEAVRYIHGSATASGILKQRQADSKLYRSCIPVASPVHAHVTPCTVREF